MKILKLFPACLLLVVSAVASNLEAFASPSDALAINFNCSLDQSDSSSGPADQRVVQVAPGSPAAIADIKLPNGDTASFSISYRTSSQQLQVELETTATRTLNGLSSGTNTITNAFFPINSKNLAADLMYQDFTESSTVKMSHVWLSCTVSR